MTREILKIIPEDIKNPQDGDTRSVVIDMYPFVGVERQRFCLGRGSGNKGWITEDEIGFIDPESVGLRAWSGKFREIKK